MLDIISESPTHAICMATWCVSAQPMALCLHLVSSSRRLSLAASEVLNPCVHAQVSNAKKKMRTLSILTLSDIPADCQWQEGKTDDKLHPYRIGVPSIQHIS